MKVAFVTFEYHPFIMGGAGIYATNITRELAKLGHQVIVFTPQINDLEAKKVEFNNLEFERIRMNERLPFKALQFWLHLPSEAKKVENKKRFDIIHFNGISYWFFKNRISKAPHVITIHHLVKDAINTNKSLISRIQNISGENSLFMPFIEKRFTKSVDKNIAVSIFTKNQIVKTYNVTSAKIEGIHNGIDLSEYEDLPDICLFRRAYGIKSNGKIVLPLGRIHTIKCIDLIADAFPDLVNELHGVVVVIAGQDEGFLVMLK